MAIQNIGLFSALTAKMSFLDERQKIISQNVANADTPGYRPHDLVPVRFESALKAVVDSNIVLPKRTAPGHMSSTADITDPDKRKQKITYEVAPAGNAVIMEEQMFKSAQTTMDYNLTTSLYQKNINMIRTALGRGQ